MGKEIAVIGGGASGLMAAIFARRNGGNKVTVYESGTRIGRKILATGNGRCNMTNINAGENNYYGKNPEFILGAKEKFWVKETLDFFKTLGILSKTEEAGKVYPYSGQASAVLDALRFCMEREGVDVVVSCEICDVREKGDRFYINSYNGEKYEADKVIVAAGGKAAPNLGSNGSGYDILKKLGHSITPVFPSLVQIKTETTVVKKLKGIKVNAEVTLGGNTEYGEVLFTDYGLSGPPIFSASAKLNGEKKLYLDIMPEYSEDELYIMLNERIAQNPKISLENFFVGMLNKRIGQAILKFVGAEPLSRYAVTLSETEIRHICRTIKKWEFKTEGTMSWNNAQVTKGGALTDEFDSHTMQSKLVSGLYACGEILDIDGDCGGYNLQWAWSSGYLAGCFAGKTK